MAIPAYSRATYIHEHDWLKITRPDESVVYVRIAATNHTGGGTANNANHVATDLHSDTFSVDLVNTYNRELGYKNSSKHLYRIEVLDNKKFLEKMNKAGIICGIHYPALHLNSIYNDGSFKGCNRSKKVEHRTASLPMNEKLSFYELEYVIDKVKEYI